MIPALSYTSQYFVPISQVEDFDKKKKIQNVLLFCQNPHPGSNDVWSKFLQYSMLKIRTQFKNLLFRGKKSTSNPYLGSRNVNIPTCLSSLLGTKYVSIKRPYKVVQCIKTYISYHFLGGRGGLHFAQRGHSVTDILNNVLEFIKRDPKSPDTLVWCESMEKFWMHRLKSLKPFPINATDGSNHVRSRHNRSHKDQPCDPQT